jgi:hypothetical protein
LWVNDRQGLRRVVDLQQNRGRDPEPAIRFTLNCGIVVGGANAYLFGVPEEEDREASGGQIHSRIGWALNPPMDWWFHVTATTTGGGSPFAPFDGSDGSELRDALHEVVAPTLERFETPVDVEQFVEGSRPAGDSFLESLYPNTSQMPGTASAIRAADRWQRAGRPMIDIDVTPLPRRSGVRVEIPADLVAVRPDFAAHFLDWATPRWDVWKVREVVHVEANVIELHGMRLDHDVLRRRYVGFLSVRYFDSSPLEPSPMGRVGEQYEPAFANLREVDVAHDELGNLSVSFDEAVVHENPGLVDDCVELCRLAPGVTNAWQEDTELIVIEGDHVDTKKLAAKLRRHVRAAIKRQQRDST